MKIINFKVVYIFLILFASFWGNTKAQSLPTGTYEGKMTQERNEKIRGVDKRKHYSFDITFNLTKAINSQNDSTYDIFISHVYNKNEFAQYYAIGNYNKEQNIFKVKIHQVVLSRNVHFGTPNEIVFNSNMDFKKPFSEESFVLQSKDDWYSFNLKFKSNEIETGILEKIVNIRTAIQEKEALKKDPLRQKNLKIAESYLSIGKFPDKDYSWYMTNSASFKFQIPITAITQKIPSNYDSIASNKSFESGPLLNGDWQLKFYKKGKSTPINYFEGSFSNGKANGIGLFVTAHPENINAHYAKEGIWKDGNFIDPNNSVKMAIDVASSILKDSLSIDLRNNPKNFLKSIQYKIDPFNEELTNGFELSGVVYWVSNKGGVDSSLNSGGEVLFQNFPDSTLANSRWVNFIVSTKDFYETPVLVTMSNLDSISRNDYQKRAFGHINSNFPSKGFLSSEKTYQHDDYLQIRESPWVWHSNILCALNTNPFDNYFKVVDFSIRSDRNELWKFIKRVRFASFVDCNRVDPYNDPARLPISLDNQNVQILTNETKYYEYTGMNFQKVLDEEIHEIKNQYPNPLQDSPNQIQDFSSKDKLLALLKRINADKGFSFNSKDTISGAWLCIYESQYGKKLIIYIINDSKGSACKTLILDKSTINTKKGFQEYLKKQTLSVNENIITVKPGEGLFHQFNYDDFKINSLSKDKIEFLANKQKVTWYRLGEMPNVDLEALYYNNLPSPNK